MASRPGGASCLCMSWQLGRAQTAASLAWHRSSNAVMCRGAYSCECGGGRAGGEADSPGCCSPPDGPPWKLWKPPPSGGMVPGGPDPGGKPGGPDPGGKPGGLCMPGGGMPGGIMPGGIIPGGIPGGRMPGGAPGGGSTGGRPGIRPLQSRWPREGDHALASGALVPARTSLDLGRPGQPGSWQQAGSGCCSTCPAACCRAPQTCMPCCAQPGAARRPWRRARGARRRQLRWRQEGLQGAAGGHRPHWGQGHRWSRPRDAAQHLGVWRLLVCAIGGGVGGTA